MADKRDILINLLGRETVSPAARKAADGVDKLGSAMEATAVDAARLDREVEQAENALRDLATQFARTDDAAQRMDLSKAMRKQQTEVRRLTRARDLLPDVPDAEVGGWVARLAGRIGAQLGPTLARVPMLGQMGPVGAAIGAAIGVAAVPTLGAAIAGGIVGGVGIGGVIGGVSLAAKDTRVRAAGRELADVISGDLEDSAGAFVGPTVRSIGIIRSAWADVADEADEAFDATADQVEPLARGLAGAVKGIAPGLRDAAVAAKPISKVIGEDLPRLGRTLGDVLSDLSEHSDEGASAIHGLFMATDRTVRAFAWFVGTLADAYRGLVMVSDASSTVLDKWVGWVPVLGSAIDNGRSSLAELKKAMEESGDSGEEAGDDIYDGLRLAADGAGQATTAFRTWNEAIRGYVDGSIGARAASRDLEAAIDAARESVAENGRTLDESTPKGRANAAALDEIAVKARNAYDEILAFNGSQEEADAKLARGRQQFLLLADAMGMDAAKAKELADRLFALPPKVDVKVRALTDQATGELIGFEKRIRQLDGRVITVRTRITSAGEYIPGVGTQLRSKGGPIFGSGPRGVDSVPALLAPGEHVLPADEVDAAGGHAGVERIRAVLRGEGSAAVPVIAGAGSSGRAATPGGGSRTVVEFRSSGSEVDNFLLAVIRKVVRVHGGDVQFTFGSDS